MVEKTDVLVIGGGPVGSCAAAAAASDGDARVTLVEEHSKVGWPDHCSGLISSSGLKLVINNLPAACIQNVVNKANFYSPSGYCFQVARQKKDEMLVLKRPLLDRYLSDLAVKKGVKISYGTKAVSIKQGQGNHEIARITTVTRGTKKNTRIWEPAVIVNAEGYKEKLAVMHGFNQMDSLWKLPALQYELENTPDLDREATDLYHGSFAPGFFAWIIPTEKDCSRVGLAVSRKYFAPVNCKVLLDRFIKKHPVASKKLAGCRIIKKRGGLVMATGPRETAVRGNMLLAGDVAGQVKATTGGGVNIGSYCGYLAGKRAARYIISGRKNNLVAYDKDWKKLFYTDLYLMSLYRKVVGQMSDRLLDRLFKAAAQSTLADNLQRGGDVDLHSKMLLKAAINPQMIGAALSELHRILPLVFSALFN